MIPGKFPASLWRNTGPGLCPGVNTNLLKNDLHFMKEIYIRNPVVVLREEFDDWAILYNPDNAEAVGTNPLGVDIWKKLDGKKSVGEIVAGIKQEFNNVPENVEAEIMEFIQKLIQRGLIGISKSL